MEIRVDDWVRVRGRPDSPAGRVVRAEAGQVTVNWGVGQSIHYPEALEILSRPSDPMLGDELRYARERGTGVRNSWSGD